MSQTNNNSNNNKRIPIHVCHPWDKGGLVVGGFVSSREGNTLSYFTIYYRQRILMMITPSSEHKHINKLTAY